MQLWHLAHTSRHPATLQPGAWIKETKMPTETNQTMTRYLLIILLSIQHHAVVEHSRLGGNDQDVWDTGQAQHGAGVVAVVVLSSRVHREGAQQLPQAASAARERGLFSATALQGDFRGCQTMAWRSESHQITSLTCSSLVEISEGKLELILLYFVL